MEQPDRGGGREGQTAVEVVEVRLPVQLRPCTEGDLAGLELGGAWAHHRELIREAWERQRRGEVVMVVAAVGGQPVGQVWVDLCRLRGRGCGYLWALRVVPWLQGRGLGGALVAAGEREIRRAGLPAAEIRAETSNRGARRLYERLGYAVVDRIQEAFAYTTPEGRREVVALDEWVLRRRLAPAAARAAP